MASNITTNTDTTFLPPFGAGSQVLVKVTGTWDSVTMLVKVRNGNGEWEQYPSNGSHTANFAYIFTVGQEKGVRLTSSGGAGSIDLWAEVIPL